MPLVYACIAPHGEEVIPALAGDKGKLFSETREGMKTLARQLKAANPDTIVIASPHNLRLMKHVGVVLSENSSGNLREGKNEVKLRAKCDVELGRRMVARAEKMGLPVVGANYGALTGPLSDLAMDWGSLVPLWFFLRGGGGRKVVIVTPCRGIPLRRNFDFGKAVAEVAQESRKRVALVASSDQAHAHSRDGPYGFSPRAKEYDSAVLRAIEDGRIGSIMQLKASLVDDAKPDSLWQMAVLAGALSVVPMKGALVSYQVPTYYGMLCAGYELQTT